MVLSGLLGSELVYYRFYGHLHSGKGHTQTQQVTVLSPKITLAEDVACRVPTPSCLFPNLPVIYCDLSQWLIAIFNSNAGSSDSLFCLF